MRDLDSQLQQLFQTFIRKISDEWNKQMPKGITKSHALILVKLHENGPMKVSDLAASLCVTPGGITGLADKLFELGYIKRQRSKEDRRVVELEISEEGLAILQIIKERNNELKKKLLAGFEEADTKQLVQLMKQMIENVDK